MAPEDRCEVVKALTAHEEEVAAEYNRARAKHGYRGVWLMRHGVDAIVLIETPDGEWVEVIRESLDSQFSHSVTSLGIECAIDRTEEYGHGSNQIRLKPEPINRRAPASKK